MESFSLVADLNYVGSNLPRIARALCEVAVRQNRPQVYEAMIRICKMLERRLWDNVHPLRQFDTLLDQGLVGKMEDRGLTIERLEDMSPTVRPPVFFVPTPCRPDIVWILEQIWSNRCRLLSS